ncbi:hypothetical protein EJ02DRAFT_452941 [Clathrospora elynae]|uniref:Uncharacterized protein n=1 Tax=Clathrospora elynae TaxID=706981 RepID=A0A6A5SUK7_9PLEO|nr:hypothetical protein EJ02DRAFT_452941 [Clathrospora elynae]
MSRPSSSYPHSTSSLVSDPSANMSERVLSSRGRPRPAERDEYNPTKLPWKKRLDHFTWSWFECTMSTGALATLLGIHVNKRAGSLNSAQLGRLDLSQ